MLEKIMLEKRLDAITVKRPYTYYHKELFMLCSLM